MAAVDPSYGAWLKAPALYSIANVAGAVAAWGDLAQESTIISPIALAADAATEATLQAAFLSGPLARDTHIVRGKRRDLIGKLVSMTGDRLGYTSSGVNVFVITATESDSGNTTALTVLKRL